MPNYSLISNAVFQPFSYQELTAPLDRQEMLHEQLQEQYDLLSEKADLLAQIESSAIDKDTEIAKQYRAYTDSIGSEVDLLNKNGLNPTSRSRWHDLRRRYGKEILPIQQMWQKREEEVKLQDTALMSDPSLEFTRDARNTSLEFYRDNPMGGYKSYSGRMFADAVSKVAGNLKKIARQGKDGHYIQLGHITPEMYETIVNRGYTPEQIDNWRDDPVLSGIMSSALNAMGITQENLGNNYERIKGRMENYGKLALSDAIGEPAISTMEDKTYLKNLDHIIHEKQADAALGRSKELAAYTEGLKRETEAMKASQAGSNGLSLPFGLQDVDLTLVPEDKEGQAKVNRAATVLGFAANGGTFDSNGNIKYASTKTISSGVENPQSNKLPAIVPGAYSSAISTSGNKTFKVSLWDKNKKLLSKDQFVSAGKTEAEKKARKKYYEDTVEPAKQTIGVKSGMSVGDVGKKYVSTYKSKFSSNVKAQSLYNMNLNDFTGYMHNTAYTLKGYNQETHKPVLGDSVPFSQLMTDNNKNVPVSIIKNGNDYNLVFSVLDDKKNAKRMTMNLNTKYSDVEGGKNYMDLANAYRQAYSAYESGGENAYYGFLNSYGLQPVSPGNAKALADQYTATGISMIVGGTNTSYDIPTRHYGKNPSEKELSE